MSMSSPLYFVGPPGPTRDACVEATSDTRVFDDLAAFANAEGNAPGLVVITERERAGILDLLRDLWDAGPGWTLAVADGDPLVVRSLSLGLPAGSSALRPFVQAEVGGREALVDLREALVQIGRTRHDVNNPLTAALAEAQILLMDADDDPELKESLLAVQEQLRRIRDLVAATGHLRLPRN